MFMSGIYIVKGNIFPFREFLGSPVIIQMLIIVTELPVTFKTIKVLTFIS